MEEKRANKDMVIFLIIALTAAGKVLDKMLKINIDEIDIKAILAKNE